MTYNLIIALSIAMIFLATTLGSATVYLFKRGISAKTNTLILGFAGGVMIAASIFGLVIPSLEQSTSWGDFKFVPCCVGLIMGGLLFVIIDKLVPHIHKSDMQEEGIKSHFKKSTKLFLAVTIHNVPEGLSVGLALGSALAINTSEAIMGAFGLAIGIAIQNFPEGAVVSLPLKDSLQSKHKAFIYGMFSGLVEPIAAIFGLILASTITGLMPWFLAFSAGAMIFVTTEDLIPDAKFSPTSNLGSWGFLIGFIVMMVLDVSLG